MWRFWVIKLRSTTKCLNLSTLCHTDELLANTLLTDLNKSNILNYLTGLLLSYGEGGFYENTELDEPLIPGDSFKKLVNRVWSAATLAVNKCVFLPQSITNRCYKENKCHQRFTSTFFHHLWDIQEIQMIENNLLKNRKHILKTDKWYNFDLISPWTTCRN